MPPGAGVTFAALLAVALVATDPSHAAEETALDRYITTPDPSYQYKLLGTIAADDATAYVLEMTSQQWRTTKR